MCMIDDGETFDFMSDQIFKARKVHQCSECRRQIEPGEEYQRTFGVTCGDVETYKTCMHCVRAREWLMVNCGGAMFGAVLEDLEEHFDGACSSVWLGRAIIGMRRKWRRRDGSMFSLLGPPPKLRAMAA